MALQSLRTALVNALSNLHYYNGSSCRNIAAHQPSSGHEVNLCILGSRKWRVALIVAPMYLSSSNIVFFKMGPPLGRRHTPDFVVTLRSSESAAYLLHRHKLAHVGENCQAAMPGHGRPPRTFRLRHRSLVPAAVLFQVLQNNVTVRCGLRVRLLRIFSDNSEQSTSPSSWL